MYYFYRKNLYLILLNKFLSACDTEAASLSIYQTECLCSLQHEAVNNSFTGRKLSCPQRISYCWSPLVSHESIHWLVLLLITAYFWSHLGALLGGLSVTEHAWGSVFDLSDMWPRFCLGIVGYKPQHLFPICKCIHNKLVTAWGLNKIYSLLFCFHILKLMCLTVDSKQMGKGQSFFVAKYVSMATAW